MASNKDQGAAMADILDEDFGPTVVVPLSFCPHLKDVKPVPAALPIDVHRPCAKCQDARENWVCLGCYETFCSRFVNGHMLKHFEETKHPMVLSFSDITVWCYECEAYVHNEHLDRAKQLAYESKFGATS